MLTECPVDLADPALSCLACHQRSPIDVHPGSDRGAQLVALLLANRELGAVAPSHELGIAVHVKLEHVTTGLMANEVALHLEFARALAQRPDHWTCIQIVFHVIHLLRSFKAALSKATAMT
jgi:hypothetical protein